MSNQTPSAETSLQDWVSYLPRPQVDRLLKNAFDKRLTTVIAGAGYGKTHAVSFALESMGREYAWLQLSEFDNIIAVLWKRLIYAIEIHSQSLANRLAMLGYPGSPASFYQFLRMIREALTGKESFVFVLDDFHSIQEKAVLDFFGRLIHANVENLSIVILSREKPRLPLAGMLGKGLMARITEDDLRFSREEMAAYYQMRGESLAETEIADLYAYTEGWILAIYLIGLSMERKNRDGHTLVSQAKIDIFALIEEEIFSDASGKLQRFLVSMALLDVVPAGLLRKLAGSTPEILAEMARSSRLIRYDPHSDGFRMHHMFKDFLLEKRDILTEEEIGRTHRLAGEWFQSQHKPEEAITHYRECGDYTAIFEIILSAQQRVAEDIADAYIQLIDQAPPAFRKEWSIMQVVKALYLLNNNRLGEAQSLLLCIREEYEAKEPTPEHLAVLGEAYLLLALISIISQNLEFVELFRKADACLPKGSALIGSQYDLAEGLNVTGIRNPIPGELQRFRKALFEAEPYGARVMNGCGYGIEYLNATDVAFMTGDIQGAERYAYETIYRARQYKQHTVEFMANFYLIRIYIYKGNYSKIALLLQQMREQAERVENVNCMTLYDIIEGWFFVKMGRTEKVAQWILREEETRKKFAPVVLGREYLVRSDCLLADEKYYELLGFIKQVDIVYKERGILYALIQNRIKESIIHHYLGDHKESMNALEAAYQLSHANRLVLQYIECGSKMRTVAQAALQDSACKIPKEWLESIQVKSSTYAKRLAQVVEGYNAANPQEKKELPQLSKRELDVLSCLCHGFTREETADHLGLSANTVRSVLQSIFQKLGAVNGFDAVRIAVTMQLV